MSSSAVPVRVLDLLDQVQDLALDRHVEGRGRLVRDQQLRPAGQRHRDHHALPHAAGELVRVLLQPPLGRRDTDVAEGVDGDRLGLGLVGLVVEADRLGQLVADREHGVEARHRLLEDHRDLPAADVVHLLLAQREQVGPREVDLARRDLPGRDVDQAHDRERGHALAAAGLADDGQAPAVRDLEAHAVDGLHEPVERVEPRPQVLDLEERAIECLRAGAVGCLRVAHSLDLGSSASRRPSPMKLMPSTVSTMAMPGKNGHHQLPWVMNSSEFDRTLPQVGWLGSTPKPR